MCVSLDVSPPNPLRLGGPPPLAVGLNNELKGETIMTTNLTIKIPVWLDKILVWPLLLYRLLKDGFAWRKIPLGDGLFALVSPPDYYLLSNFHWIAKKHRRCTYACRFSNQPDSKTKMIMMHREIMNPPKRLVVDHKNGLTLDNRRPNLRFATRTQNAWNTRKDKSKTTSRFYGVTFDKARRLWATTIRCNGKKTFLGRFKIETDAALAYDAAARKFRGEFAVLNFPDNKND